MMIRRDSRQVDPEELRQMLLDSACRFRILLEARSLLL